MMYLRICTFETYMILLTNVTPVNLIIKKECPREILGSPIGEEVGSWKGLGKNHRHLSQKAP